MIYLDNELAEEYLAGCREGVAALETELLAIETGGAEIDGECVNRALQAVRSIKAGAAQFALVKIRELAHRMDEMLSLMRSREMAATPYRVGILLRASDRLNELIQNPAASNQADIAEIMGLLAGLPEKLRASPQKDCVTSVGASTVVGASKAEPALQAGGRLRVLLVDDDFASRLLLQTFLSRYGECHIAVNGREAVDAFRSALGRGQRYDLICMDIMMPEMDGREAVRQVRAMEEAQGVLSNGAKIFMTTAVEDFKEVVGCFNELCDAYLRKPIDLGELRSQLKSFELIR